MTANPSIIDLTGKQPASPRSPAGGLKGPPVSGVEFLDVQQPLFRAVQLEEELVQARTASLMWFITALVGWSVVAVIICLL